jgi:hypothetical protein
MLTRLLDRRALTQALALSRVAAPLRGFGSPTAENGSAAKQLQARFMGRLWHSLNLPALHPSSLFTSSVGGESSRTKKKKKSEGGTIKSSLSTGSSDSRLNREQSGFTVSSAISGASPTPSHSGR